MKLMDICTSTIVSREFEQPLPMYIHVLMYGSERSLNVGELPCFMLHCVCSQCYGTDHVTIWIKF